MNQTEHTLEELDLDQFQVNEVLACILHTIVFIRSPGPVRPKEHECELFGISYGKCGTKQIDMMVENAISAFRNDLQACGPELFKGTLRVIFYENRKRKSFFGGMFGNGEEEFPWEQWTIPVLINESSRAVGNDAAAALERDRRQQMAEQTLHRCMLTILAIAHDIDHVSAGTYKVKILTGNGVQEKRQGNLLQKAMQSPMSLHE